MKQRNVDGTRYGYNGRAAVALGILQLVLGTGCLVIGIICIFQLTSFGYIGHGVWCGTMFIVAGSVVVSAGFRSKDSLVIAATALSAAAMFFCIALAGISCVAIYYDVSQDYCYDGHNVGPRNATADDRLCGVDPFRFCSAWASGPQCLDENGRTVSVALSAILSAFAVVEFAIALSSVCLVCSCCSVKDNKVDDMTQTAPPVVRPTRVLPPAIKPSTNVYEFEDGKSYRGVTSRTGVPPEWRVSYAN